ncbi:alpha/beta hydrolase family protein [Actinomadura scrupuli]|uniref:alpha/beta hydrolase family protein n=1 Tax=Actinomadura scrupuli TaxID=559629 RepID=UPI003D996CB9
MSREVLGRAAPDPDHTVPYGPHPDQVIDIRLPARVPAPLVVLVHGGFWRAEYDRTHTGPMADALAAAGHLVAVPEYRRSGAPGGGWPGTFDDVAAAFDAVGAVAERYGADPARTVWAGHSAGGHLALWAAARHRLPPGSRWHAPGRPPGVVSLAGCASLELCDAWDLDDGAAAALMGGSAAELPERYAMADPAALLPLGAPVTLLHGTGDDRVPVGMSRAYASRAARAGDAVTLTELPGADHFALIDPLSPVWPRVLAALAAAIPSP